MRLSYWPDGRPEGAITISGSDPCDDDDDNDDNYDADDDDDDDDDTKEFKRLHKNWLYCGEAPFFIERWMWSCLLSI